VKYLDTLTEERETITVTQRGLVDTASAEGRDLTEVEETSFHELTARAAVLDERISAIRTAQVANLEAAAVRAEIAATDDEPTERAVGRVTITDEPATYDERSDHDFLGDVIAHKVWNSPEAGERLARHQREYRLQNRATGTTDWSALVIPTYAIADAQPFARAGRPFLDLACAQRTLGPTGMTTEINRTTTGASAAVQATQNSATSETDQINATISVPVVTVAGQNTISRQAVERGSGIREDVINDLVSALNTSLDAQAISGTGSSGQAKGIYTVLDGGANEITYTDASPTVAELYPKLADAIQRVQTGSFGQPTHWLMHPRRVAWVASATDSQNRPLMVPNSNGPANAVGVGEGAFRYGNSGYTLLGLPVVADANVQTDLGAGTEDAIYCVNAAESILWEAAGSPMALSLEEPNATSLGWTFVVYAYASYTAEKSGAVGHSMITGTGLIAPTF